jgi:hypothetical protein
MQIGKGRKLYDDGTIGRRKVPKQPMTSVDKATVWGGFFFLIGVIIALVVIGGIAVANPIHADRIRLESYELCMKYDGKYEPSERVCYWGGSPP